jgi:hypothetical protein
MKGMVVQALTSRNSEKTEPGFSSPPSAGFLLSLVFDPDAVFIDDDDRNTVPDKAAP